VDVVETAADCRELLERARAAGRRVGLVPTMGALHDGHVSLMTRARAECDTVVVSIFVNPLQFGDASDLEAYPRTLERDLLVCAEAGADVVFVPSVVEMYPSWPAPPLTSVTVQGLSEHWEGASRPGHFDGVATVVAKLFAVAGSCRAYFGEKDFQQLGVVRRLASDLCLPVQVVGCAIVREPDGLALSSRNVRLSATERDAAPVLLRALAAGQAAVASGSRSGREVADAMAAVVALEPLVELDYAVAVDADGLDEVEALSDPARVRLLVAARVGPVRLIDNCPAVTAVHRDPAGGHQALVHDSAAHADDRQPRARQLERTA
jgi:pantoate--beta-alanine ligase